MYSGRCGQSEDEGEKGEGFDNHLSYILRTDEAVQGLVSRRHDSRQHLLQLHEIIVRAVQVKMAQNLQKCRGICSRHKKKTDCLN